MTFRIKLRIKSVNPCYPVKAAPVSVFPSLRDVTDPDLLRRLYEAAKSMRPIGEGPWTRRWMDSPGLPDPRFNPTCSMTVPPGINWISWNGGVQ